VHHVAVAVGRHWEANPSGTQTAISSDYDANTKRCGVHHSGAARAGRHPRPDGEDETGASSMLQLPQSSDQSPLLAPSEPSTPTYRSDTRTPSARITALMMTPNVAS